MKASLIITLACLLAYPALAETPWERFLKSPTPANAANVQAITYSPGHEPPGGYTVDDLQILQNQVLAQDSNAFQLAVRLYRATDGGLAEDLGVMIGRAVRPHPAFFLREVGKTGGSCALFAWPLNAAGLEYVDRPEAREYELMMRRKALSGVSESSLQSLRDQCVEAIETERPAT